MAKRARAAVEIARSYWRIAGLLPSGGAGLVGALLALNVVLGLLPVTFVIATSIMIGRVPPAVSGGVGSLEWQSVVVAFALAAASFGGQRASSASRPGT